MKQGFTCFEKQIFSFDATDLPVIMVVYANSIKGGDANLLVEI